MLAFTVVLRKLFSIKTLFLFSFQDFLEQLLVQVNPTPSLSSAAHSENSSSSHVCLAITVSNHGLPAPSPRVADGAEQEAVLCWFVSFKEIIPEEE